MSAISHSYKDTLAAFMSLLHQIAEWAGHTAWERGGTAAHWRGRPPKEPFTALQAFQLYLRSHQPADKPAEAVTEAEKMHAAEEHMQVRSTRWCPSR